MSIEQELFSKARPDVARLLEYGFRRENDGYHYSTAIMQGDFRADIHIAEEGTVSGRLFDLTTDEEYVNIHITAHQGAFVNAVREAYRTLLTDILTHCFTEYYFVSAQANRLVSLIFTRYGDRPDFPWEKYTDYAVFRNPVNQKWYGLIMHLEKSKLQNNQQGKVDVLNLKVEESQLPQLLTESSIYPAYHMNKKSWVSIILDETVPDERIWALLERSHQFALQGKGKSLSKINGENAEWIIPANPKYYDVEQAFRDNREITWKQSNHIAVNDIVYMYVAAPRSAILYKCRVTEVLIPYHKTHPHIKINHLMKISLLQQYPPDLLPFTKLKEFGINAVRGPRNMPPELSRAIAEMTA